MKQETDSSRDADVRGRGWHIRVPATAANLGPGFDCFGLALQRYLSATARRTGAPGGWDLTVHGEGADTLPLDKSNLVYRAFLLGAARGAGATCGAAIAVPGVAVDMTNEIPLARGQGSSAAAIVIGLTLGHLLTRGEVDRSALIALAAAMEGHPDNVASAVMGGLVLTRDAGGSIHARPIPTRNGVIFVSAVPAFQLATHASRAVLPRQVSLDDAVFNLRAAAWMAAAWAAGDWEAVAEAMEDRLHQPYRAALIPGFHDVCAAAREAGALAVCLSGSGPTIMALTVTRADEVGQAMEAAWRRFGVASRAEIAPVDTEGLRITPFADADDASR